MRRRPGCVGVVRANIQVNQVVLTAVVPSHRCKCFPIHALLINAQATPGRLVLKDLMSQLIDARSGLTRAGVAGNQPATTKLIPPPCQSAQTRDTGFSPSGEQKPKGNEDKQNAANQQGRLRMCRYPVRWETHWIEWSESKLHGHTFPMRNPASRL